MGGGEDAQCALVNTEMGEVWGKQKDPTETKITKLEYSKLRCIGKHQAAGAVGE